MAFRRSSPFVKLNQPVAVSCTTGEHSAEEEGSEVLHKAIGRCPELMIQLGKANIRCLLDTGAQVSTITEACFNQYFGDKERLVNVAPYIYIYIYGLQRRMVWAYPIEGTLKQMHGLNFSPFGTKELIAQVVHLGSAASNHIHTTS